MLGSHRGSQRTEPLPERLYSCQSCSQTFDHKSEYKTHVLLCKRELVAGTTAALKMVECSVCSKLFRSQEGLAVHVAKDHEVR
jgi:hypothetical protein